MKRLHVCPPMATSCGSCMEPPSSPMKHGAILLVQLQETMPGGRDPLTRWTPLWHREWGRFVARCVPCVHYTSRMANTHMWASSCDQQRMHVNNFVKGKLLCRDPSMAGLHLCLQVLEPIFSQPTKVRRMH